MRKGKEKGEREEKKPSATDWVNYVEAWKLKNPCVDGATHKKRGDGCHALFGCQNSKFRRHLHAHFGSGRGHLLSMRCR